MEKHINKKHIVAIISLWTIFACAQKYDGVLYPMVDKQTFLWGYADSTRKNMIISYKYEDAGNFHEGLAMVKLNEKTGWIDKEDKVVIPLKYDVASDFWKDKYADMALVGIIDTANYPNCKFGFIDRTGKEVIPLKYEDAKNLHEGLAMVKLNKKTGWIDKEDKVVIPLKYDVASDFWKDKNADMALVGIIDTANYPNCKFGFIDRTGKEVIPLKYEDAGYFYRNLAMVKLNGKAGYIDRTGKIVVPLKYDFAGNFVDGIAHVGKLKAGSKSDIERMGYVDTTGREVIPMIYDYIEGFYENLAKAQLNGKKGFIDQTGKEVIPVIYDDVNIDRHTGGLITVYLNGKMGVFDKTGKVIFPLK